MKRYFIVFARHNIALIILLFLAMPPLILPIPSSADNESPAGDEPISLEVKDEPLGNVLKKISTATGYDIILDNKWQNYRVTASLNEVSLHDGLKRILRNLNSAIIYISKKKIKIVVYDKTTSEEASYAPSTEQTLDRTTVPQPPSYRPLTHRNRRITTPQAVEKADSSKADEEPSDNPVVSDQELETGTPDSDGEEKAKPERLESDAVEGTNKDLEHKSSEENPEQDNRTEQTSGGETDNSKGVERTNNN